VCVGPPRSVCRLLIDVRALVYRQQSVSGVTRVPSDMFQGLANKRFVTFGAPPSSLFLDDWVVANRSGYVLGFEYWANPSNIEEGYIWWQVDGNQTHRIGARAMGADPEEGGGAGIGQRLIPEEPMAIILNLGMSRAYLHPTST
jgi:beta-glucan synthesis-associated protein KRE6